MFLQGFPLNFNMDFLSGFNYFTPTFFPWQKQPSVFSTWNNNLPYFNKFSIWNSSFPNLPSVPYVKQPFLTQQIQPTKQVKEVKDVKQTKQTKQTSTTQKYKIGNFDLNFWKTKGYDHTKGQELAIDAAKVKRGTPGQCVGYTRKTINRVYGTNFANAGAAEKFGTTILSQPQLKNKFKKANMKDIEKGGIPDGAVVLWKAGSPGFTKSKAALYGHGGICYQGKVYSNYVETKHLNTCSEIWIPVKA